MQRQQKEKSTAESIRFSFFSTFFNLPSKDDYNKLLAKLETVQGSLVNVNMKLDRLLAEQRKQKKPAPRKKPPGLLPPKL
jgi:hypothetical protein